MSYIKLRDNTGRISKGSSLFVGVLRASLKNIVPKRPRLFRHEKDLFLRSPGKTKSGPCCSSAVLGSPQCRPPPESRSPRGSSEPSPASRHAESDSARFRSRTFGPEPQAGCWNSPSYTVACGPKNTLWGSEKQGPPHSGSRQLVRTSQAALVVKKGELSRTSESDVALSLKNQPGKAANYLSFCPYQ